MPRSIILRGEGIQATAALEGTEPGANRCNQPLESTPWPLLQPRCSCSSSGGGVSFGATCALSGCCPQTQSQWSWGQGSPGGCAWPWDCTTAVETVATHLWGMCLGWCCTEDTEPPTTAHHWRICLDPFPPWKQGHHQYLLRNPSDCAPLQPCPESSDTKTSLAHAR